MKKKSLIIPCYNEERSIESVLRKVNSFVKGREDEWEIIFVNDGSKDNTLEILREFEPKFFKVVSYDANKGKGYAVKKGVLEATGGCIGFIDADLPYSFENLEMAFESLEDSDIVIGSRRLVHSINKVRTTKLRRILGKGWAVLSELILSHHIPDTQCGLKVFKKEVARDVFSKQTLDGFSFDVEILYIAKKKGYEMGQVPAYLSEEHSYVNSRINLLSDSIWMFFTLIEIKLNDFLGKYE